MKILLIGLYPPSIGGISTHTYYLKKNLEERGHKVYVLTYDISFGKRLRGVSFLISGIPKALKIMKSHKIDLIHAHYLAPPGFLGLIAKLLTKKPLVVTAHGSDVYSENFFVKILSKVVVKFSDAMIGNSKNVSEMLKNMGGKNVYLIYGGIDLDNFKPRNVEKRAITYVGALVFQKDVSFMLKALKGFDEEIWIVGDGPERKRLEILARNLGLKAKFLGYRRDIPEILSKSKVLILPSRSEGFGLTLLEGMACGVPVMGRKVGGITDIIDSKNGILFETEEELAKGLKRILEDRKFRNTLIKNGFETSKKFSWKKCAEEVEKVYEDVIR